MLLNKKHILLIVVIFILLFLVTACEQHRTSGKGLYLPKGDIENGKQAFTDLNCHQCHTVTDIELPAFSLEPPLISLELGGELYRVKSYGELITSITNPNHIITRRYLQQLSKFAEEETNRSPMLPSNDEMTVSQLIDLVTFLDSQYKKIQTDYYYRGYFID